MIKNEVNGMEENEILQEEPCEGYVPRPRWQVWGARLALVVFLLLTNLSKKTRA